MKNNIFTSFLATCIAIGVTSLSSCSGGAATSALTLDHDFSASVINPATYHGVDFSQENVRTRACAIGYRGEGFDRFDMHLDFAVRKNTSDYYILGQTRYKGMISPFTGYIYLDEIQPSTEAIDHEMAKMGVTERGTILGHYEITEFQGRFPIGKYEGKCSYKYLVAEGQVYYDALNLQSDGYCNNQYEGIRVTLEGGKMLNSMNNIQEPDTAVCNWGDFRIPGADGKLDIGCGEFFPSEDAKANHGWAGYDPCTPEEEWWKEDEKK